MFFSGESNTRETVWFRPSVLPQARGQSHGQQRPFAQLKGPAGMLPAGTITLVPGQGPAAGCRQQTCTASSARDTSAQLLQAANNRKKKTRETQCNEPPPSTEARSDAVCLPTAALAQQRTQQPTLTARSRGFGGRKPPQHLPARLGPSTAAEEQVGWQPPELSSSPRVCPPASHPALRMRCWSSPGQKRSPLAELYHSSPNRGKREF